jgi:hypothetical protein
MHGLEHVWSTAVFGHVVLRPGRLPRTCAVHAALVVRLRRLWYQATLPSNEASGDVLDATLPGTKVQLHASKRG